MRTAFLLEYKTDVGHKDTRVEAGEDMTPKSSAVLLLFVMDYGVTGLYNLSVLQHF